jgi:hypothetical protein
MPRSPFAQRGPSRRGYTHLSTEYCELSERPLPPNVAGGSAERAWAMPCSPGVDYFCSKMRPGLEAGGFGYLSGMRVLGRYAARQPNTHSRRNRTRSTVRVNLNEAVTCLTDLEEEHSRSLARSHVACRCTASARSAKPCPAMTNREEYFMQHHASSTHWEEVPCALTLCEYVGSISCRLIHMWTCPRTTYVHPRYTLETTRTLS